MADRMSYDEFAQARLAELARYAVILTGDPHSGQDLVQETMVRVQLKWRQVGRADAPERYVKRMMINIFLDWRRSSWWRRVVVRPSQDETVPVPHDHADQAANRHTIWNALAALPRQQRAAVVLRYYEDLPDQEIADVLGCGVGTVRGYISRALASLRADAGHPPVGPRSSAPPSRPEAPGSAAAGFTALTATGRSPR